jgi:hypothetical protein
MKPSRAVLLVAGLSFAAGAAQAQHKAHQHGLVKLDVAVEGAVLSVALEAPLDSLVGFERAPRTEAEKRAAADALTRLRDGAALFKPDAAAQCTLASVDVKAPVLEGSAKPGSADGKKDAKDEHADLDADYRFQCAQPQQLRALDIGLLDAFKRIQRIETQVVTAKGQSKVTLKRPARTVVLAR